MKTDKARIPDVSLDLRVRERLLAAGTLDPKALAQHLAELPDLEPQAESIDIEQPALAPRDLE